MTTPGGTISAQDVANEFGLGRPISFSQFYGKGGAPGSGPISLGDMRNRSSMTLLYGGNSVTPQNGMTYTAEGTTQPSASFSAQGSAISWTRSGSALGSPDSGSGSGGFSMLGPARQKADTSTSWDISVNGISFRVTLITTGTLND